MGRLFDLDSPIMRFLNRMADMIILNILMMICCIPIITVGAACTAMHYVLLKMVRDEEGYLIKGFFKSFVRNFKQATLIWLFMLLVLVVLVGDWMIFGASAVTFPKALVIGVAAIGIIALMVAVYVFPVLARFDNSIKNTILNAAILAVGNLPKTLLMIVIYAIPFVIAYFSVYSYVFIFMFGISLPAYGAAWLYSNIFKKLEPQVEQTSDMDFSVNVEWGEEEGNGKAE